LARENHILPQLGDLDSTAQSDNPFIDDARTFVSPENIGLIQGISARNMRKINSRIPTAKGHTKWLWMGSAILLISSLGLYLGFSGVEGRDVKQRYHVNNITPRQYQNDFTFSMSESSDDHFRPNYQEDIVTENKNPHSFKEEDDLGLGDANSDDIIIPEDSNTEKEDNPYADDNTNYEPLSGEKFKNNRSSTLDRDANVPLKFAKAVVAKQENYYVFSEGKSFSYNMSEMPQYRGGKSKVESDLHAGLSKVSYPGSFDKKVNAVLTFVVDSRGKVKDIKVIGTPNAQIKMEIIRAVNGLGPWSKSSKSGKKGSLYYEIMLSFH
jgi:hypothetical protein